METELAIDNKHLEIPTEENPPYAMGDLPMRKILTRKHLITGEELSPEQITQLLQVATALKQDRSSALMRHDLKGRHLALLFDKPSLRTRFSFTIAMRELGGDVVESTENSRKSETPEDQARVLSGYCHAIMVRTHAHSILEKMRDVSKIPIINGLSNEHHPCQILSDLLTLQETFGSLTGLILSYVGDGNNILHSLLSLMPAMGIHIHYCCPEERQPNSKILASSLHRAQCSSARIKKFSTPEAAVSGANIIYTDVWTSMGFENQHEEHLFNGFQINAALMAHAHPQTIFMHCLPMERGKEVSMDLPDQPCSVIFQQSENRLHMQKALLLYLLNAGVY